MRSFKKTLAIFVVVSLFAQSVFMASATTDDFISIKTPEEFLAIANDLSGNYRLSNNIIFDEESELAPLGDATNHFTGTLDGNGYTVKNLNISGKAIGSSSIFYGLFVYNKGTIKDLTLVDYKPLVKDGVFASVGSIATVNLAKGKILNCSVNGNIDIKNSVTIESSLQVGGIVAEQGGTLENTLSNVEINIQSGTIAKVDVGGISAKINGNIIKNCQSSKNITLITDEGGEITAGGIVGKLSGGTIDGCVNKGTVSGTSNSNLVLGGVLGGMSSTSAVGIIKNSVNIGDIDFNKVGVTSLDMLLYEGAIAGIFKDSAEGENPNNSVGNRYLSGTCDTAVGNGKDDCDTEVKSISDLRLEEIDSIWYKPTNEDAYKSLSAHKYVTDIGLDNAIELSSGKIAIEKGEEVGIVAFFDDGTTLPMEKAHSGFDNSISFDATKTLIGYKNCFKEIELYNYILGDLNRDNSITVTDSVILRNRILNDNATEEEIVSGDIDETGYLTVTDIVANIEYCLERSKP